MTATATLQYRKRACVRVPATTSNLGPGFDVLGLALKLYNDIEIELLPRTGPAEVEISGAGQDTLPRDEKNLAVRAVREILPRRSISNALRLRMVNRIPLARGLGSSAAARLGGLMAAWALFAADPEQKDDGVLQAACRLEGHPDNVVAAYHGGLCASYMDGERVRCFHLKAPRDLVAVLCVPEFELPTRKARAVLPREVPLADAVGTAARVAMLVGALQDRRYDWLKFAMSDVLHQPYRRRLVPGMDRVIEAALKAGALGAALSGAGPSILALAPKGSRGPVVGRAMQRAFLRFRVESRALMLDLDARGAAVTAVE